MIPLACFQLPHHHVSLLTYCFYKNNLKKLTIYPKSLHKTFPTSLSPMSDSSNPHTFHRETCSLASLAPIEAILFDIDGTLCDSDPLHYYAFRKMLQEVGFNGGAPITEEFFMENISGRHNEDLCGILFPEWDRQRARKFMEDKEAMFRRLASERLAPMKGLQKLCQWIEDHGLKRAAVTKDQTESS